MFWDERIKAALHAEDRRAERIPGMPAEAISRLQALAKSKTVNPGFYHLPLKSQRGVLLGHAAFKTVGDKDELVLATILGPKMRVKGTKLEDSFDTKVADELEEKLQRNPFRAYAQHAALNLGQAARDVRHFFDHPHADRIAPQGSLHHVLSSISMRVPSLANNLYYAALPPQLHHTQEELNRGKDHSLGEFFMAGYEPWNHPLHDPEKQAVDLSMLHSLLDLAREYVPHMAAAHVAGNVLQKAIQNTQFMRNMEEKTMAAGFRHGLEGQTIHPALKAVATRLLGPESTMPYELARRAGGALGDSKIPGMVSQAGGVISKMLPQKVIDAAGTPEQAIANLRTALPHVSPELANLPVARSVPGMLDRLQRGEMTGFDRLPTALHMNAPDAAGAKGTAASMAATGLLEAALPGARPHIIANNLATFASQSAPVAEMGQRQLLRGLSGQKVSPVAQGAASIFASPMYHLEQNIGNALHDVAGKVPLAQGMVEAGARRALQGASQPVSTPAVPGKLLRQTVRPVVPGPTGLDKIRAAANSAPGNYLGR